MFLFELLKRFEYNYNFLGQYSLFNKEILFENTYVTLVGGGATTSQFNNLSTPFFWKGTKDIVKGVRPYAGLELGKYVTPVVGFSIEGLALFNTTGSNTIVDQSNVVGNLKLNLSNWFGGYPGRPRVFEVVLVPGLGWGHDYGNAIVDRNYLTYNAGVEFNFNLGKERAWQINVRPGVLWFHKEAGNYVSSPVMTTKRDGRVYLEAGLTYKFGNRRVKSHNFVTNTYDAYQADYDALNEKYNELKNREPEVVTKTVVEENAYIVKQTRVLVGSNIITFNIGSAALTDTEKAKIDAFAKSLDEDTLIQIVGSADSKTGSENRNFALAQRRAEVVKNTLVGEPYKIAPERISVATTLDATDNVLTSRSAILTLSVE